MTKKTKAKAKEPEQSGAQLGQLVDSMFEIRERKRAAEAVVKEIEVELEAAEKSLLEAADKASLTGGRGSKASFVVTESIVPQVSDWDKFHEYILKERFLHLLQRRPSVPGCRELFELKGSIPGVERFNKRGINLRSL